MVVHVQKHTFPWCPLMNVNKVLIEDLPKVDLLNNVFVSQSTIDESKAQLPPSPPNSKYTIIQKIPADVYKIWVELDAPKAIGPDPIIEKMWH